MSNEHRLLSDFYDSIFQRSYWRKQGTEKSNFRIRFLGKMRLDAKSGACRPRIPEHAVH